MLNVVHLHTLQAVLESGSFSGAAKDLGYTTSAVSQQVAALERAAGVRLFERGPRNLWPTAAALRLGRHAAAVLTRLAEAEEEMRGFAEGYRGRLGVAGFATGNVRLLPRALAQLLQRFPEADVTLQADRTSAGVVEAVCQGRTDLGLVFEYDSVPESWPRELSVFPILDEDLIVITATGRGRVEPAPPTDLATFSKRTWATNREGSVGHESLVRLCAQAGFQPEVQFLNDNFDVIRGLVREGLGVALVPALALGVDPAIQLVRLTSPAPRRKVFAISRASDENPLLATAVETIIEASREFVAWTTEAFVGQVDSPLAALPDRR